MFGERGASPQSREGQPFKIGKLKVRPNIDISPFPPIVSHVRRGRHKGKPNPLPALKTPASFRCLTPGCPKFRGGACLHPPPPFLGVLLRRSHSPRPAAPPGDHVDFVEENTLFTIPVP